MFIMSVRLRDKKRRLEANGFSVSAVAPSLLFVFGIIGVCCVSSLYHSVLYGYTGPSSALLIAILCAIPFGYRIRVALSDDFTTLYHQHVIFGVPVRTNVKEGQVYGSFKLLPTEAVPNQYYFVLTCSSYNLSVHYAKISRKKVQVIQERLTCMLGLPA